MQRPRGPWRVCLPDSASADLHAPLAFGDAVDLPLAVEFDPNDSDLREVRYYWFSVMMIQGDSHVVDVEDIRDIQFGLIWRSANDAWIFDGPSFDRGLTIGILDRRQREHLRNLICQSVHLLLAWCAPSEVTMRTAETHVPERALRKFEAIDAVCQDAGWRRVDRFRDEDGREHWHFRHEA